MIIHTIDPAGAKPHTIAVWQDGELVAVEYGLPKHGADETWIEMPWKGRALLLATGHLVGRLNLQIEQVRWIQPSVWKRALSKTSTKKTSATRLETYPIHQAIESALPPRQLSVYRHALAAQRTQGGRLDVCDAVGIGVYVLSLPPLEVT